MSTYDDDYDDERFKNLLAVYKPRAWKQEATLDMTVYSKPEPTSKTHIRPKTSFLKKAINFASRQHF